MSYQAPKKIVRKAAKAARAVAVIHDDLDLDIAQAHVDAAVEAMLWDSPMFNRAAKAAGSPEVARATLIAFFDVDGAELRSRGRT